MRGDATHNGKQQPSTAAITKRLIDVIGRKLTAYIGNATDVRVVELWAAGGEMSDDVSIRLRFTLQLVQTLLEAESPAIIQAWLMGINPELADRVPIRLIRQEDLETVAPDILRAARSFLAEG